MRVAPYPWPEGKRCAVALHVLFDDGLDAIQKAPDLADRSKSLSVWEYGARRGVERISRALETAGMPATWLVPGAVAQKHRSVLQEIAAVGDEIASHGWCFERYDSLDAAAAQTLLERSRNEVAACCGKEPEGFRLPTGNWPPGFDGLLFKTGFGWSATLNGDERPYTHPSGLVEIPVHLELEDRPYFQFNFTPPFPKGLSRLPDYEGVLGNWRAEFDAYRRYGLCFVLQVRPEMIATPGRIFILHEMLAYMQSFGDVWFARSREIAAWHRQLKLSMPQDHPLAVFSSYRQENGLHDELS